MQQDPAMHDLRLRIVSDEPVAPIGHAILSLILRRIETADPLSDQTKGSLVSAISALDSASRSNGADLTRTRLSSALLHLHLALAEQRTNRDHLRDADEILGALSRNMLGDAVRKILS